MLVMFIYCLADSGLQYRNKVRVLGRTRPSTSWGAVLAIPDPSSVAQGFDMSVSKNRMYHDVKSSYHSMSVPKWDVTIRSIP